MSIYASNGEIGHYPESERTNGDVLAYIGSHVFPSADDPHAVVYTAWIPGHCVPGHEDDESMRFARFLRLDVATLGDRITSTVVLTERGARALRDELSVWLGQQKIDPIKGDS